MAYLPCSDFEARRLLRLGRVYAYSIWMRLSGPWVENESGIRLFLDPLDPRAQSMHRGRGVHDVDTVKVWKGLAEKLEPTVVVDVGANYGEVALSTPVDGGVRHLIEPNPRVVNALRTTVSRLPKGSTYVHECAASDHSGLGTLFLRNNRFGIPWSGIASLEGQDGIGIAVEVRRLDDFIPITPSDRILFKIDVEGHEVAVLKGMMGILNEVKSWVGLCETSNRKAVESLGFSTQPATSKDFILRPRRVDPPTIHEQ